MTEYRWQARARLDGRTLSRVGGGSLHQVTVCLSDDDVGELCDEHGQVVEPPPPVVTHLRPSEARELAFCLLELAEVAEQRSGLSR
jgi:hypothetical protein